VKPRVQVQVSLCISETLPLSEPAIAVYDVLFELVQGSIESNQVRGIRQVISKHHKMPRVPGNTSRTWIKAVIARER
jgi:hypothetical protein